MEKVQEQREEIQKMVDAILVRQGSPSFIHQLRSLLEQIEAFLRRIHVSSTPYSTLHTPYSIFHTSYSTPHTPYSTANTVILHILTTYSMLLLPMLHTVISHTVMPSYCHTLIPHSPIPADRGGPAAEGSVASTVGKTLPSTKYSHQPLSLSLSVFIVVSHHLAVGQYTHHSIDMYW